MKKAIIVSGLLLLSMFSGMLMLPTTNVVGESVGYSSDAARDGYLLKLDSVYPQTTGALTYDAASSIKVGQSVIYHPTWYSTWRGYISFDTTAIPDGAIIKSVDLKMRLYSDNSDDEIVVQVWALDYETLDTTDWGSTASYQGSIMYTWGATVGNWYEMALDSDIVNVTGYTGFRVKSSSDYIAPTGDEYIAFYSGDSESPPILEVTYLSLGTLVTIDLLVGDSLSANAYPSIQEYNLTYDVWGFEVDTVPDAENITITKANANWTFTGSTPECNSTETDAYLSLTDVYDSICYRIWFTVPKTNPYTTVHLSLFNAFTGNGFFWESMKVQICDGATWDNTTSEGVARPDFNVEPGHNYTIRVLDFFDNTLVDYPFMANAQDVFITIPVPYYSWQVFNMNEQSVLMKIYWNNTGSPWEFFVGPQWIIERNLKGGNYTFAVTFYNSDNTVGDTVYYERTLPLAGLNASFIYVNGTTLSEIITDIEGVIASQTIITSLISPSIVLIYEDLPIVPVRIRGMVLSEMISLDPYMILEATVYQNKTGTQFVNSALWLPYPDILGATYYNISDTLQFVGTYDTTIYINDTSGTNLYYGTVLPATVNLQSQNITIWANENYSVSRTSTWREVSEYEITNYQTEHKWQTTLSLNNSMSFDYHSPYWYVAFPEDAVIDTTTVTVYDLDNDVLLDGRLNYAVTAGGIHVTLTQMNASNARNFQLTFWDANSTTGIGAPNLVAEAYTQSTLDGTPMKYTAVQWTNPWSVEYRGEVYITMNFTEGADLFVDSITIIDETSGTVIPSSQWIYTGRTILILTDGVGTVPVGGARNYGIYFTLSTTIDRDDDRPDIFFGPIVINGKQWYINDWPISAFAILLGLGWCIVGWRWWGNKKGASNLLLIAVSATVIGMYFYYMMN